jgi:hypothetical protein
VEAAVGRGAGGVSAAVVAPRSEPAQEGPGSREHSLRAPAGPSAPANLAPLEGREASGDRRAPRVRAEAAA